MCVNETGGCDARLFLLRRVTALAREPQQPDQPTLRSSVGVGVPTVMGEATHQSLALACALGYGNKLVPSLLDAHEKLANVKIVPR